MRKYVKIKIITLHWQGEVLDDLPYGPAEEAKMLTETFANWGWQTEDYMIPLEKTVERTKSFLRDAVKGSNSDELLVVYYVGHGGSYSKGPTSQSFVVGRQGSSDADVVVLEWPVIRSVLEAAPCDVVMFLNCCHGAEAWVSRNLEQDKYIGPDGKLMVCLFLMNHAFGKLLANISL